MPPLVSVLVPVYNCAPFLDQAIWSIRHQTFEDFECVVVNDGSTDDSLSVLRRHAAEDPRLVIIDKPNGGIVSALNAGLEQCRGEFVSRMDGDDISLPHRFEHQVAKLTADPTIALLGGWAQVIDGEGREVNKCSCSPRDSDALCWCSVIRLPTEHGEIDTGLAMGTYTLLHPAVMARASILRQIGGYDTGFRTAEDLDLFLRVGEVGRLANLPEIILKYRRRSNSQTMVYRSGIAKWDARALRAAKARGRHVTPLSLARAEDRISWTTAVDGRYRVALVHALKAFAIAPWSLVGYRAVVRVGLRAFGVRYAGARNR